MSTNSNAEAVHRIGRCTHADGDVLIAASGGTEKPHLPGAGLRSGDKILTGSGAEASFKFTYGTTVFLSADSVLVIDAFAYESDAGADAAYFSAVMGMYVIEAGDLTIGADDFLVMCGDCTLNLRGARIALRVDPVGYDMVTLLPSDSGPQGEVLVHNKIGVQLLNRAWQTLRLGGGEADIPAPLTLPSSVVRETFAGPGMSEALFPAGAAESGDDLSEQFQPFRSLQDRLLERQFIARDVFPSDGPVKSGDGDAFVEDAFEGTRFRLVDPDPEASG